MKIGVLMYTYNRTDDARINQEIIRSLWKKSDLLKDVTLVHAYNGLQEWWPEKYLEDELLRLENPGHFAGAEILLNEGVKCFQEKYPDTDYVIILASDTWLTKPEYIAKIISTMRADAKYLATCAWGTKRKNNIWNIGMALDFNVIDLKWSTTYGLFPIRFKEFMEKYSEPFYYEDKHVYLERVFALRFKQGIFKSENLKSDNLLKEASEKRLYRMSDREPIHVVKGLFRLRQQRKMHWADLGIFGDHEPEPKRAMLRKIGMHIGMHADKLMSCTDTGYYNAGVQKIGYGD